ncbi:MAG: polyhydroxyalkanoate synthesis regulator DNA-binding domain-containing protein [Desulfohalobiaceae bacterium]
MSQAILIKKYANRRLYNTRDSKYITLEQLSKLIKQGEEVQVQDAKSGVDVTAFILTQIILEESKDNTLLPVSLLHTIIRHGDSMLKEFFERYLEQMIEVYMNHRSMLDNQFKQWLELGMDFSGKTQESMLRQFSLPDWMQAFHAGLTPGQDKDQDSNK